MRPTLRAEAIVTRARQNHVEFLVQRDEDETFYRFPGGGVEFGETAADAICREFIEELDRHPLVGDLLAVESNGWRTMGGNIIRSLCSTQPNFLMRRTMSFGTKSTRM